MKQLLIFIIFCGISFGQSGFTGIYEGEKIIIMTDSLGVLNNIFIINGTDTFAITPTKIRGDSVISFDTKISRFDDTRAIFLDTTASGESLYIHPLIFYQDGKMKMGMISYPDSDYVSGPVTERFNKSFLAFFPIDYDFQSDAPIFGMWFRHAALYMFGNLIGYSQITPISFGYFNRVTKLWKETGRYKTGGVELVDANFPRGIYSLDGPIWMYAPSTDTIYFGHSPDFALIYNKCPTELLDDTKVDTFLLKIMTTGKDGPTGYATTFVDTVGIDSVIYMIGSIRRGHPIE